ncbi:fluoride efflux transporter FluC [Falsihalocynthiibacter arcticus]|uniref:fluoride efflux transporter FluC n=1 Tax=Falsihalocynthiibacter arcticus TaxID=1579316 RepID=UPI0014706C6F
MIDLAVEAVSRTFANSAEVRVLFITVFLGGFTTFSSFSLETMEMLERGEFFSRGLLPSRHTSSGLVCGFLWDRAWKRTFLASML